MDIGTLIEDNETEELLQIVKRYFNNDFELFFKHIIDEGYIANSDEILDSIYEIYPKNYIEYWMDRDPKKMIDYIVNRHLGDVRYEDGKYYMVLDELSDLKFLFRSDAKSWVESILSHDYDPYHHSFSDFGMKTEDLIRDLDTKSKTELLNNFNKYLGEFIEYSGDDDTIASFVEEDGDTDSFKLTQERLDDIIGDDDSIASLINDTSNFIDIGSTLANAYADAYSTAERDEYYNMTIKELKYFFETDDLGYYSTKEGYTYDKEGKRIPKMREIYLVNITKVIKGIIMDTVANRMSNLDDYNDFDNLGSFEEILKEYYSDDIRVDYDRVSPDYNQVDTLFNEYFRDNI